MAKLIAFDIDGTLLDSWPVFEKEIKKYSHENNMPIPCLETIKTHYANSMEVDFKWGLKLHEQRPHLHNVYQRVDLRKDEVPPLFDGTKDFLNKLKKMGYTLGIVTSKPSEPMYKVLKYYNLENIFSSIRTSCDVHKRGEKEKPAPDQLLSLVNELEFDTSSTIMIGDTTMDIEMGLNAGSHTIGVTWGNHCQNRLKEAGAHKIVSKDFDELLQNIINIG